MNQNFPKYNFKIFIVGCLLVLNANAEYKSCEGSGNNSKAKAKTISVLLGMNGESLGDLGVGGAGRDLSSFEKIAKVINHPDEIIKISPKVQELDKNGSAKVHIINKLKAIKGTSGPNDQIHFMYAGHGELCTDPFSNTEHWCLVAGINDAITPENYDQLNKSSKLEYFKINNRFYPKSNMITETELMGILGPKSMFLDSCHSGKAAEVLVNRKDSINGNEGSFVFASSMSNQISFGNYTDGGYLTSTVLNLISNFDDKTACLMDWEGTGEISDRALTVASMLAFNPDKINIKPVSEARGGLTDGVNEKINYQMVAANPNGNCMMKHNAKCENQSPILKKGQSQCSYLASKNINLSKHINDMIKNKEHFKKFIAFSNQNTSNLLAARGLTRIPSNDCKELVARGLARVDCNPQTPPDCSAGTEIARGLARVNCNPQTPPDCLAGTESVRGLSRTKDCTAQPTNMINALDTFFNKFKNDLNEEFNQVCQKSDLSFGCAKIDHENVLGKIDMLFENSKEILFKKD